MAFKGHAIAGFQSLHVFRLGFNSRMDACTLTSRKFHQAQCGSQATPYLH